MKQVQIADELTFEIARGAHVGITSPSEGFEPQVPISWPAFVKLVTTFTVSESKVGTYVCRPMGGEGNRSDANALPWPLLPLDLDELLPDDLLLLERWCEEHKVEGTLTSTWSSTRDSPRARLWILCSRPFNATEHLFLFKTFNQLGFPFKLDPATQKPSQPIYLPRVPAAHQQDAFARVFTGNALNVDRALEVYQEEIKAKQQRNDSAKFVAGRGVRTPGGIIDAFNKNCDVGELLEAHGYRRKTRNRFIAPGSKSGRAALLINAEGNVISFHDPEHDPLAAMNDTGEHRIMDPFAVFTVLEHRDDFIASWKDVAHTVRSKGWIQDEQTLSPQGPRPCEILNGEEAISQQHMKPRDMLIAGLLPARSITLFTGKSNSAKTTIVEYMAICVAFGLPFAGREVKQGKVLWIAGEDAHNTQMRLAELVSRMSLSHKTLRENLFLLLNPISILDRTSMSNFHLGVARQLGNDALLALIVGDSKSVLWGGRDENSNDEAAEFLSTVEDQMVRRYQAAVGLTHHLRKSKEEEEQEARGASALINNIEQEIRFSMNVNSNMATMEPGKLRIKRWEPIRFKIGVVPLSDVDYPFLRDNLGNMPDTSIPEIANAYGVTNAQLAEEDEYVNIMIAMGTSAIKVADIAQAMGKSIPGADATDATRARRWVNYRLKKMLEQKIIEKVGSDGFKVTSGGLDLVVSVQTGRNLALGGGPEDSDAPATKEREREPGED